MQDPFLLRITTERFDANYQPADTTRLTTNFANLARGAAREQNLRFTLDMIERRFNELAAWDNPRGDRYALDIDIVSVLLSIPGDLDEFPIIEMLNTTIIDKHTHTRIPGMIGNSFSSYVRDYDFSVLLPKSLNDKNPAAPVDFGQLHGKLFKHCLASTAYQTLFAKPPVICLSVSSTKTYQQTENTHPILGTEYLQSAFSSTDEYFAKMGLSVRYFLPKNSAAPLAFYFSGDLLRDYTDLELISTISTMESFQKIYRPEIYNANSSAGADFHPSLSHQDYSLTRIAYDRVERSQLAIKQGTFTERYFINPHRELLTRWAANTPF